MIRTTLLSAWLAVLATGHHAVPETCPSDCEVRACRQMFNGTIANHVALTPRNRELYIERSCEIWSEAKPDACVRLQTGAHFYGVAIDLKRLSPGTPCKNARVLGDGLTFVAVA